MSQQEEEENGTLPSPSLLLLVSSQPKRHIKTQKIIRGGLVLGRQMDYLEQGIRNPQSL